MKIAVMTGGGVAPGMNAAVRAAAQAAFSRGWEVLAVEDGYVGLLEGRVESLDRRQLGGLMQKGGSVLGMGRSGEFSSPEGQQRAREVLEEFGVEGLVVVGGGGSLSGGLALSELGVAVAGVPATIDNDVPRTEMSVGVDTAVNTAVGVIDRLKDTAGSHNMAHFVEVLGRDHGYLALASAIAVGAEAVLVPEYEKSAEEVLRFARASYEQGKPHFIAVVAEGASVPAKELCEYISEAEGVYEGQLTELGHIQSGGPPTAFDRVLAGRLGGAAVEALEAGEKAVMSGIRGNTTERVPLEEVAGESRPLEEELYELAGVLAELP